MFSVVADPDYYAGDHSSVGPQFMFKNIFLLYIINYVDCFITDECCGDSVGENGRRQGWKSVLSRILIGIEIQKFLNE